MAQMGHRWAQKTTGTDLTQIMHMRSLITQMNDTGKKLSGDIAFLSVQRPRCSEVTNRKEKPALGVGFSFHRFLHEEM